MQNEENNLPHENKVQITNSAKTPFPSLIIDYVLLFFVMHMTHVKF